MLLIVCITLFVIFLLFSLWLIRNIDKFKPGKTGYGLQRVAEPTQEAQEPATHSLVSERNVQNKNQGARKKQAKVAPKKKVAYCKLKPKIYVEHGNEMIELKELGNNSLTKSPRCEDLNFNVGQAEVEVHGNEVEVHGKDPIFKKVKLMRYKGDYHLVTTNNERLVSHIL